MIIHKPEGMVEIDPCTVTDAELAALGLAREWADTECYFQQLERECNDQHGVMLQAYRNYDSLTVPQKDQLLKALLRSYISDHRAFYMP